jgi:hypothetical protein
VRTWDHCFPGCDVTDWSRIFRTLRSPYISLKESVSFRQATRRHVPDESTFLTISNLTSFQFSVSTCKLGSWITDWFLQTNSVAFSPQANYTDWATTTCWRNLVPTFVVRGMSCGRRGGSPTVVNLFSRPEPLLFFQVPPHLSSQGLSGPRFRTHCYSENLVALGIELGTSGFAARKSDH